MERRNELKSLQINGGEQNELGSFCAEKKGENLEERQRNYYPEKEETATEATP